MKLFIGKNANVVEIAPEHNEVACRHAVRSIFGKNFATAFSVACGASKRGKSMWFTLPEIRRVAKDPVRYMTPFLEQGKRVTENHAQFLRELSISLDLARNRPMEQMLDDFTLEPSNIVQQATLRSLGPMDLSEFTSPVRSTDSPDGPSPRQPASGDVEEDMSGDITRNAEQSRQAAGAHRSASKQYSFDKAEAARSSS